MAVQVENLRATVRGLEAAGVAVDDLKDVFSEIAAEGTEVAARLAPHKTGALRATIRGNRAKGKAVVTVGKAKVKYAGPVNYGWPKRNIRRNGFLQKADAQMQDRAVEIFERGITTIIEKAGLDQ